MPLRSRRWASIDGALAESKARRARRPPRHGSKGSLLVADATSAALFVSKTGERFTTSRLTKMARRAMAAAWGGCVATVAATKRGEPLQVAVSSLALIAAAPEHTSLPPRVLPSHGPIMVLSPPYRRPRHLARVARKRTTRGTTWRFSHSSGVVPSAR